MKRDNNQNQTLLNDQIPFPTILLIDEDQQKKYLTRKEALKIAEENGLDLLCVSPNSNPPVCKLINYQKVSYLNKKRKKRAKEIEEKELRISYSISPNDLEIKIEKAVRWIEKDIIVKVTVRLATLTDTQIRLTRKKCQAIVEQLKNRCSKIELSKEIHQELRSFSFTLFKNKKKKEKEESPKPPG